MGPRFTLKEGVIGGTAGSPCRVRAGAHAGRGAGPERRAALRGRRGVHRGGGLFGFAAENDLDRVFVLTLFQQA